MPKSLALAVAAVSELVEGRLLRRHPSVPLEAARMSTSQMSFDISRARQELGYAPRPAVEALEASARWFAASGMVSESRLSRIRWSSDQLTASAGAAAPPPSGTLVAVAPQFIYTMRGLTRFYPPDREVLKGINLSFYPGAKIGVIGSNGSGKSSLLRIMAGEDDGFSGEARLTPGFTVGYLPQEPQLDESKDVAGNVAEGVGEAKQLVDRYNEVCAAFGDPDADIDALLAEQADLQTKIDAAGAWELDRTFEIAMDALRLPPGDADVTTLSGGERRRVALCRLLLSKPDLLLLDEPTNHLDAESVAWLERTLQVYPGTVVAVTHDRYFLDNVAGWILELDRGAGIPWEGNYSSWLEQKQARLAAEEKADRSRQASLERELEWIRMSPRARQSKGKARITAYNELVTEAESTERRADKVELSIPPGPRLGDQVVDAAGVVKAFGDHLLMDGLSFTLPPGGIVGVIGPERSRQDDPLQDDRRRGEARCGQRDDRRPRSSSPTWTSRASRWHPTPPSTRRSPGEWIGSSSAGASCTAAPTWRASASRGATSRRRSASSRAASATGCCWPRCSAAAATSCSSTSRPTIWTSTRCGRSRTRSWPSPAVPW